MFRLLSLLSKFQCFKSVFIPQMFKLLKFWFDFLFIVFCGMYHHRNISTDDPKHSEYIMLSLKCTNLF